MLKNYLGLVKCKLSLKNYNTKCSHENGCICFFPQVVRMYNEAKVRSYENISTYAIKRVQSFQL